MDGSSGRLQLLTWTVSCQDGMCARTKGFIHLKGHRSFQGKVDKIVYFLTCGSEILMFVKETGTEVIYKMYGFIKLRITKCILICMV